MMVSLKHEHGSIILFDFKAAFPSVSHPLLINCLQKLGPPQHAINLIVALYSNNDCCIRMQGQDYPGFKLLSGVKQGCPLSPLLFAVCVDILLRMIGKQCSAATIKAFADDIGAVLTDFNTQAPILESIFSEFSKISNLHLNLKKTICIPLWEHGVDNLHQIVKARVPIWANLKIDTKGTYLGFVIGPAAGASQWDGPTGK